MLTIALLCSGTRAIHGVAMRTFTIDPDNNITVLAEVPEGTDRSTVFSTERELAKIVADWP